MKALLSNKWAGLAAFSATMFGMVAAAGATATYDISPVTSSVTGELTSNLPVILGVIGALIALTIAVRAVRKFVRV